jgi:hypothetical protein
MVQLTTPLVGANPDLTKAGTGTSFDEGGEFPLGAKITADNGQEFIYLHASAAVVQYDAVGYSESFEAAPLTDAMAADGWGVAFSQVAAADNDFFWAATKGSGIQCNLLGDTAVDADLWTTGAAGKLDDSSGTGTKIDGVVNVSATATATAARGIIATFPRSSTF